MKKEKSVRGMVAACAFVLLMLGAMFVGVVPVAAATTWTVDDSGGADFMSIQDAVDAASIDDIIIVRDRKAYIENIKVSEKLTIKDVTVATAEIENPVVLFSIPNEIKVTFMIGEEFWVPKTEFQIGEWVGLTLDVEELRGGNHPAIANDTTFVISDDAGNIIWNKSVGKVGEGWSSGPGGGCGVGVSWGQVDKLGNPVPAGDYTAGVIFTEPTFNFPEDFSGVIPITVIDITTSPPEGWSEDIRLTYTHTALDQPSIAVDSDKNANIVWTARNYSSDGTSFSQLCYTKRDRNGIKLVQDTSLTNSPWNTYIQSPNQVAIDSLNNVHIVWDAGYCAYWGGLVCYERTSYTKLDVSGNRLVDEKALWSASWPTSNSQQCHHDYQSIVVDSNDNLHISINEWARGTHYLKLDNNGNVLIENTSIGYELYWCGEPSIAVDSQNNVYLTWFDAFDIGIHFTKLDSDGNILISNTKVSNTLNRGEARPKVAIDTANNIHIIWQDEDENGIYQLYYTKLDGTGNVLVGQKVITYRIIADWGWIEDISIDLDSTDNLHIAWPDNRDGNFEIYYTKIDNNGNPLISDARLTSYGGDSVLPSLAVDSNNKVHVAWYDNRHGFSDIYYKNNCGGTPTNNHGKIAFASSRDGNQEVYVINADGSGHPIDLTNFPDADDGDPTWSPDGKQIAFSSDRSGNWKTYVMDADDGSNQVCLLEGVYDAWGPTWSPDGKEIAFACQLSSDDDFEIYTMDIQSKALTQVTDNSVTDCHPAWSPNSHKIVFTSNRTGNNELYVADLLANTKTRLTDEPAYDDYPEWSPDGSMIVFVSERDGNLEIYSMDIASKAITRLTYNEYTDKHAQWSPDGQKIIFVSDRDGGGDLDVYVMNADGTSIACLVDWEGDETHPTWSPSSAPDQPPTCAIELQKNGIPIANINVGDSFDIYVGDSTDDQSIKEVRFSSDDAQDGNPTGEWTDWYDWDTSSGDWNAVNKIKAWSFATAGEKEVWAEVKDGGGVTDKGSANIYANQLPIAKPVITSPLEITPIKDIYYVGDNVNADFTIANRGGEPVTFDVLTVGGRLNGWCPTEGCPDFTHKSLTLPPGESYLYEGSLTLTQSGNYHFFIAYYIENPTPDEMKLLDENNWNTCVELGEGLTPADRIKNIIALEEEISSPDTVSELRDRINHNLQRQVKYPPYLPDPNSFQSAVATVWASFTSWITQTHLTEKCDEFYQTGIDYDCLRFKALKDARDSLDRGDIVSAKKYLQKSYTYEKMSTMSFGAAAEVFENNLATGEILAEGIKDGCDASVKFGLGVTNPEAAKAADYIYLGVDYAVDRALLGEEQAVKNAIVNAVVTTTFNEIKFGDLGDRTIADYTENRIGKVTFPMLQEAFQNNEPLQFALSKIIKECGVGIEEAVAEDIATHILNELEQAVDFKQIEAKSPVEVQVYGPHGDVTGLLSGTVEHGIPRSLYCKGTVTILYPLDSYRYEIAGTDEGTYGLDIASIEGGEATTFTATDIPTAVGATHEYTIDWTVLSQGEAGVTVQVDSDGDGTFENTFTADNVLTQEEFLSGSDGEPIPEFATIIIPVAIVLGLVFLISRRKRKR